MKLFGLASWNLYLGPTMFNRKRRLETIKMNINRNLRGNDILCFQEVHSWIIGPISKLLYCLVFLDKYPKLMQILDIFSIIEGLLFPIFLYNNNEIEIVNTLKNMGYFNIHTPDIPNYYINSGLITASKYKIEHTQNKKLKSNIFIPSNISISKISNLNIINCHLLTNEDNLDKSKRRYFKIINKICCFNYQKMFTDNNTIIYNYINNKRNIIICGDLNINFNSLKYYIFIDSLNLSNIALSSNTTQCPKIYPKQQIDYFLHKSLDQSFRPTCAHILKMNYSNNNNKLEDIIGSDHFAIETKI